VVDRDVVAARLASVADRVARVRARAKADPAALAADRDSLDLVAFNLMLAVQACLDVASHVIADEGWLPAAEFASAFRRLQEHGAISEPTASALVRAAGLRNVVAHAYGRVDVGLLHAAATLGTRDLERFTYELSAWVERREDAG